MSSARYPGALHAMTACRMRASTRAPRLHARMPQLRAPQDSALPLRLLLL